MHELLIIIRHLYQSNILAGAVVERKYLPIGKKSRSKIERSITSLLILLLLVLILPLIILKILTNNISNKDADDSVTNLSKDMIIREGVSNFEWRDYSQVVDNLIEKNKISEMFSSYVDESSRDFFILISLIMGHKFDWYDMRIETKEEFIDYHLKKYNRKSSKRYTMLNGELMEVEIPKQEMEGRKIKASTSLSKKFDELQQFDELEQIMCGRRLLFKTKNIGNEKEPPMWLISWLMPQNAITK